MTPTSLPECFITGDYGKTRPGSANTAFAAHIRALGADGRIVVEQGFEIGRPSRLYLDVAETIRVGGKVRPMLTGRFDF